MTLHRPALVDHDELQVVLGHLDVVAATLPVVFPVHPRTRARIDDSKYPRVRFLPPLGYLEFLSLESEAAAVLTDSGGIQEETTYLGVPCFTLRSTTERPVTIRLGTNTLLGSIRGNPTRLRPIRARATGRDPRLGRVRSRTRRHRRRRLPLVALVVRARVLCVGRPHRRRALRSGHPDEAR